MDLRVTCSFVRSFREGDGWDWRPERDDVYARKSKGLRQLGSSGKHWLGLRVSVSILPEVGRQPADR